MSNLRWFSPSQPQTLQTAVILLYFNAAIGILYGLLGAGGIGLAFALGGLAGGYGIANEKRWGYYLSLAVAVIPAAISVLILVGFGLGSMFSSSVITLLFQVALVVLLIHPMSREYQRIWFK